MPTPLLDRRCSPAGSFAAALQTVFLDTFTDSDKRLYLHTPDTAPTGTWQEPDNVSPFNAYYAEVKSNRVIDNGGTSANRLAYHSGAITQHNGGVEVYLDAFRDDVGASAWRVGFMFLVKGAHPVTEAYACAVEKDDATHVRFTIFALANSSDTLAVTGIPMAASTSLRIGVTINSNGTVTGWTEPAGGGTRTTRGTYTPPGGANYFDSSHTSVGLFRTGTPGLTNAVIGDNLTVNTVNATPGTTWTLPYSVATDGSEGTLVAIRNDTGAVIEGLTRPSATTVLLPDVDLSGVTVTIGISYEFLYRFSTLYPRNQQGGADTRGTLQLRNARLRYRDSQHFDVGVTPVGRTERTYGFDEDATQDGNFRFPIITRNEDATIEVTNDSHHPSVITGLDWEGELVNRSRRI